MKFASRVASTRCATRVYYHFTRMRKIRVLHVTRRRRPARGGVHPSSSSSRRVSASYNLPLSPLPARPSQTLKTPARAESRDPRLRERGRHAGTLKFKVSVDTSRLINFRARTRPFFLTFLLPPLPLPPCPPPPQSVPSRRSSLPFLAFAAAGDRLHAHFVRTRKRG